MNHICSPEMSFNSAVADQPHAYVAYVDGEKEMVPVNFIFKFPPAWRTDGWNKNYLYKVFWSPDEDSPSDVLKRLPEIPVIEGTEKRGAGYYRASVELVKETLPELISYLDSKRLSIGLSRYKFTSNDLGQSPAQTQTAEQKKQHSKVASASSKKKCNKKQPVLKNKKESEVKKKKNKTTSLHDMPEVKMIRSELSKHLPQLFVDSSDNDHDISDDNDDNPPDTKTTRAASGSRHSVPKSTGETVKHSEDKSVNSTGDSKSGETNGSKEDHKCNALGATESEDSDNELNATLPVTQQQNSPKRSSRLSSHSSAKRRVFKDDDSTSSSDTSKKKVKLDPDFTPRKYVQATEEIVILKATNKRISDLNLRLQENLLKLNDENSRLQTKLSEFKANCQCSMPKKFKSPLKKRNDVTPAPKVEHVQQPQKNIFELSDEGGAELLCETTLGEASEEKSGSGTESVTDKGKPNESQSLWTGVAPALKEMIQKIPPGPKKDVKFVKELSIVMFGPEVLGASSIFGTKKGSKGKGEDVKVARPSLDKEKLQKIEAIFIERLCSENIPTDKVQEHERFNKKRINDAMRDAQKWCRERGYGVGALENTVNVNLFGGKKVSKN